MSKKYGKKKKIDDESILLVLLNREPQQDGKSQKSVSATKTL